VSVGCDKQRGRPTYGPILLKRGRRRAASLPSFFSVLKKKRKKVKGSRRRP